MKDQKQMERDSFQRIAEANRTFMEIQNGSNPLTKKELRALIKLRPDVYGRYKEFAK